MATYYVGPGGNDGNSGLTWALRKLTLNGAEDVPVVANDTVWVGPGVYRELLTVDVSGGGGQPITYIGDETGENTDQVGGIVRITGSDNDQTAARANCITSTTKTHRTFRGFRFDFASSHLVQDTASPTDWIIEDCRFLDGAARYISLVGNAQADCTIRRCVFFYPDSGNSGIRFDSSAGIQDSGHIVENCLFVIGIGRGITIDDIGGVTMLNNDFLGPAFGVIVIDAPPVGYTANIVRNSTFAGCGSAVRGTALGEVDEDFNTFYNNATDRTNTAVGANSVTYPPLLAGPLLNAGAGLVSGFKFPWWFGELSEWSQIAAITGSNEPTEDLRGIVRPTTAAKNSWGPIQFHDMERETGTVRTGSVSIVLHDAGVHQIWVPVANESTTISVYVWREANYAGTLPRMVIKQPGQADDTTTDVAAASQWNLLTTTLTPAADPPYVIVELQSLNTAAAGNYDTFFDDLVVN